VSVLSYTELTELVDNGVIDADPDYINGASIDITLGNHVMIEVEPDHYVPVNLIKKETIQTKLIDISQIPYVIKPGEFLLASSRETFNLPDNIACEFKLKSSLARSGLGHALAGWCDPGWSDSKLTLELSNTAQHHRLKITAGMKIGQMIFFRVNQVPQHASYKQTGQYNGQKTVTASKGVR